MRLTVAATALALALSCAQAMAQVPTRGVQPPEAAREISRYIAAGDVEKGSEFSGRLMGGGNSKDRMAGIFRQIGELGTNQYFERVYTRRLGSASYDIIDLFNFEKAMLFVRYQFYVEKNEWRLMNFTFKTENGMPFPREWVHIYPDATTAEKP